MTVRSQIKPKLLHLSLPSFPDTRFESTPARPPQGTVVTLTFKALTD